MNRAGTYRKEADTNVFLLNNEYCKKQTLLQLLVAEQKGIFQVRGHWLYQIFSSFEKLKKTKNKTTLTADDGIYNDKKMFNV